MQVKDRAGTERARRGWLDVGQCRDGGAGPEDGEHEC